MLVTATERYAILRCFSPAFLQTFAFNALGSGSPLIKAINILREANLRKTRDLPEGVPWPFANRQWKQLITEGGRVDRRLYETAVMATLRDRLRIGDFWVEGTRNYQRFDAHLLNKRDTAEVAQQLAFNTDAQAYLSERAKPFDWRLRRFGKQLKAGKLEGV